MACARPVLRGPQIMWEQIRSNKRKTFFLMVFMALLLVAVGYMLAEAVEPGTGPVGLALAVFIWLILALISYFKGDSIFLGMSGARQITRDDFPMLYNVVEEMKIASGLPTLPKVYVIDDPAPNAFATGRKPEIASVAVTTGLLKILNRSELQGVIAHEVGHIVNRDILYMMVIGVMMGSIVLLADIGIRFLFYGGRSRSRSSSSKGSGQAQIVILAVAIVLMILAPIIAQLIYFSTSRKREYLADASSALYTRYPEALASALEKLGGTTERLKSANRAMAPLYIVNPLKLTQRGLSDLTSTHPPLSARVKILRSMAGGVSYREYDDIYKKVTRKAGGVIPASALAASMAVPLVKPVVMDDQKHVERHREVTDGLWKLNHYQFVTCACGVKLKIPPEYQGRTVRCPRCGKPVSPGV